MANVLRFPLEKYIAAWHYETLPDGAIVIKPMVQCVHCQGIFEYQPGSGKTRGFCHNCMGPVCGKRCARCVNWEQKLDNVEAGKDRNHKPTRVSGFG